MKLASRRQKSVRPVVYTLGVSVIAWASSVAVSGPARFQDDGSAARGTTYELLRYTVDAGGVTFATSGGGHYELSGTIGQPDAGETMAGPGGSGYELTGGFWFEIAPGDIDGDGGVTLDDYDRFADCLSGEGGGVPPDCGFFDKEGDGDIDLVDYAEFLKSFTG